jgi:hypothetical protein
MSKAARMSSAAHPGLLLIWTDTESASEDDFNRWYDREHMGERIALPGFESARRFIAHEGGPRYLALYRTSSLDVFRSANYRNAFANQTEWSKRNFARMRNTVRRVGEIAARFGAGEGGALSLFVADDDDSVARMQASLPGAVAADGIVAGYVVRSDPELSVPLVGNPTDRIADTIAIVEGTGLSATARCADRLARDCGVANARVASFRHLWSLHAR